MSKFKNIIISSAVIAILGIAINAFAHDGMRWDNQGPGWSKRGGYGQGYSGQMSAEEYEQFELKREAFFKETQDLRANLFEKERELQNELAKEEPDVTTASELQKELSQLQSQLDQKRIDHMIEMRKLNPNAGRGFMSKGPNRGFRSYGRGNRW